MTEPKNIEPDLPEEETPAFDEPPAPVEDPPYEGDDAPDLPDEPEAEPDFEPLFEPDVDVAAEPEPEPEPEFEPLPEPEPEPVTDLQPEPDPEPELYEPELFEDEPAVAEPVEAEAAPEEVEPAEAEAVRAEPSAPPPPPPRRARPADVVEDLHGPEPWDEAPVTPLVPAAPEPVPTAPVAIAEAQQQAGQEIPLTGASAYEIKRAGYAVYLLYLSGLVAPVLPLIVGVMFASNRVKDAPAWLQSHYTFQIRTFWITLAALGAACLLLFLPFGLFPLTIVATAVWLVMRCFVGMVRLHRGEPIFNPQTWTV